MIHDKFYEKVFPFFHLTLSLFEDYIKNLNYNRYNLLEYNIVYVVEDSFIISFLLVDNYEHCTEKEKSHSYAFFNNNVTCLYHIEIHELTANEIFSFNASAFSRELENKTYHLINSFYFLKFYRFFGRYNKNMDLSWENVFEQINHRAPFLRLEERNNAWQGWLYNFLIFKFSYHDKTGFCTYTTTQNNLHVLARKGTEFLCSLALRSKNYNNTTNRFFTQEGYVYDHSLLILLKEWLNDYNLLPPRYKKNFDERLTEHIRYTYVRNYIDSKIKLYDEKKRILQLSYQNKFFNNEFFLIDKKHVWKSEYLVFEICKKLYGEKNVLFQHRPFFLRVGKSQLSYDIFIPKIKIAIEYQGKQHYEPVSFFGGEESFRQQQQRDKQKLQLSKENNIKLIYISYKEEISKSLIQDKISKTKGDSND